MTGRAARLGLLVALLLGGVLGTACNGGGDMTLIRIHNDTGAQFSDLVVQTPGARQEFGELGPGADTDYREFGEAYSYAYVSVVIDGQRYVLQPADYTGERPLGPGRFTYHLSVLDPQQRILASRVSADEPQS